MTTVRELREMLFNYDNDAPVRIDIQAGPGITIAATFPIASVRVLDGRVLILPDLRPSASDPRAESSLDQANPIVVRHNKMHQELNDDAPEMFGDHDAEERCAAFKKYAPIIAAVRDFAVKHYNENGWDFVVEAWEDEDILEQIELENELGEPMVKNVLTRIGAEVSVVNEVRRDRQAWYRS